MSYPRYGALAITFSSYGTAFGVLLLGALISSAFAISLSLAAWRLDVDGVDSWATVKSLHIEERRCRSGKHGTHPCDTYTVEFVYVDTLGRTIMGTEAVGISFYQSLKIGKEIPVRYVPGESDSAEISSGRVRESSWFALLFTTVLSLIAGFGLSSRAKTARQMITLRDFGDARQATVTDVVRGNWSINGLRLHRIVWRDTSGTSGKSQDRLFSSLPSVGMEITVFVDGRGESDPVWEGDAGSR